MQNLIVILIGLAVLAYVSWKMYKILTHKPSQADKCGGCTGCALKIDIECNENKVPDSNLKLKVKIP